MKKFALAGFPISLSESPALFRQAYGGKYRYDLIETPDFEEAWARFLSGYAAVNVTAPFKGLAFLRADSRSPEAELCKAANVCVLTDGKVRAYNSDCLAVESLVAGYASGCRTAAVLGLGGAGRAALAALGRCGFKDVKVLHHDELRGGVDADLVIHTLSGPVEGDDLIRCRVLFEANYTRPALAGRVPEGCLYVGGREWLAAQATAGYELMTGEPPVGLAALSALQNSPK